MTDDELHELLSPQLHRSAFDRFEREWKEWAIDLIQSDDGVNQWSRRDERAQLYLCRLLWIFKSLREHLRYDGYLTEDELLPNFVSGAVLCGLRSSRDIQFTFHAVLENCVSRGLVLKDTDDRWEPDMRSGSSWVTTYQLTIAGAKFAEVGLDESASSKASDTESQPGSSHSAELDSEATPLKKSKRSTVRGEGQEKLIAALTKHHKYADGSCLNLEPVGNNELARLAEVAESTASAFFKKEFGGHMKYLTNCSDNTKLIAALKLLNQEFSPHHLFGAKPPGEDEREDEE